MSEQQHTPAADKPALVAIVGKSDSGKTTLVEKVVPELVKLGLRVGTVKHDAHSFEIDHPSQGFLAARTGRSGGVRHRLAGAARLHHQLDGELPLTEIVGRYYGGFDIVVAEGTSAPLHPAWNCSVSAQGTPSPSAAPARRSPSSPRRT